MVMKGFHQFCKVVNTFLKAPDMTFFALQGALQAPKVRATYSRGFWGKKCSNNTVSSVSGTQESVSQARLEFT